MARPADRARPAPAGPGRSDLPSQSAASPGSSFLMPAATTSVRQQTPRLRSDRSDGLGQDVQSRLAGGLPAEELEPLLGRRLHALICSRMVTVSGETSAPGQPGQG
jgi:hypothetical protein